MKKKNYLSILRLHVMLNINSPFGWGELWGIADRTDYDLSRHMEHSKKSLEYLDPQTNENIFHMLLNHL